MARKHSLKCAVGSKRFTVIEVFGFNSRGAATADTYAGRNFEAALRAAQPDRGNVLRVSVVCARDAGEARLPSQIKKYGTIVKSIRYKRGG
jgi:hypothetical protein